MSTQTQKGRSFIWLFVWMLTGIGLPVGAQEERISKVIENLVTDATGPYQQELKKVYAERQYEPMWISNGQLNDDGRILVEKLQKADQQGLDPEDYDQSELHWLQRTVQLFSEEQEIFRTNVLARFDVTMSHNFLKFLDHATGGRISPEDVNGQWHLPDERPPLSQMLVKAHEEGISPTLTSLAGKHIGYAPLLKALNNYQQIEADGGWPDIAEGPLLAQGARGSRVANLRRHLALTGDLPSRFDSSLFDQEVVKAVKQFQARHGLPVDGLVGQKTLASLNVPVESRIQQLLVNLERRRWLPPTFGSEYLVVNIPDFRLKAYRNNVQQLTMPVIVGKPMNQTPIFSDILEYVVFNPYWYVPRSIAKEDILPKVQGNPDYLEKKNYELVDGDDQILNKDLSKERLRELLTEENIESFTVRIRQKPGPANALGLVKFMFPNDHAIYLHDTPADQLFEASKRDFSHGCIRVERPNDLAEFLLDDKWSRPEILQAVDGAERQKVHLPEPIPVYILYLTARVAEDGTVQFRDDPYGHDEQLWTALNPLLSDAVKMTSADSANKR